MATLHVARTSRRPKPAKKVPRSVFLSAPSTADVSTIRRLLEEEGVRAITAEELVDLGQTQREVLTEAIGNSDRMIAVVPDLPDHSNVLFELGLGIGLGKNVLLITGRNSNSAPDLMGIPFLRAGLDDEAALRFGLMHFLREDHGAKPHRKASSARGPNAETAPIEKLATRLVDAYRGARTNSHDDMVRIVESALRASGAEVVNSTLSNGSSVLRHVDLGVWTNDFLPWTDKPIVVEVKRHIDDPSAARKVCLQLQEFASASAAAWGLLVYGTVSELADAEIRRHAILAIPLEELLVRLQRSSLGEVLFRLRNEVVHTIRTHG